MQTAQHRRPRLRLSCRVHLLQYCRFQVRRRPPAPSPAAATVAACGRRGSPPGAGELHLCCYCTAGPTWGRAGLRCRRGTPCASPRGHSPGEWYGSVKVWECGDGSNWPAFVEWALGSPARPTHWIDLDLDLYLDQDLLQQSALTSWAPAVTDAISSLEGGSVPQLIPQGVMWD